MKNFMHKKWLGIPVVAIVAVLLVAAVSAAAIITLDHKTQTVTQPWVAITPAFSDNWSTVGGQMNTKAIVATVVIIVIIVVGLMAFAMKNRKKPPETK